MDSKEESLNQLRENNYGLYEENCRLNSEVGRLQYQINTMQACRPGMDIDMDILFSKEATSELQYQIDNMQACRPGKESEMDYPLTKEKISGAPCSGWETAEGENYLSDDNLSLSSSSVMMGIIFWRLDLDP